jgi:hypothetical protein
MKQWSKCIVALDGDGMVNLTKFDGYKPINFTQCGPVYKSEALTCGQLCRFLDLNRCYADELTESQDVIVDEEDSYHFGTVEYI